MVLKIEIQQQNKKPWCHKGQQKTAVCWLCLMSWHHFSQEHSCHWLKPFIATNAIQVGADGSVTWQPAVCQVTTSRTCVFHVLREPTQCFIFLTYYLLFMKSLLLSSILLQFSNFEEGDWKEICRFHSNKLPSQHWSELGASWESRKSSCVVLCSPFNEQLVVAMQRPCSSFLGLQLFTSSQHFWLS